MLHKFSELTIGGVLFAPFVMYAFAALCVYIALRPVLGRLRVERIFANPPVAGLSLYLIILAGLIVFT
jgi:predicted PurR-regulated permease PerM